MFQQTTKAYDFSVICALIVNKKEFSVYTVRIFMTMYARLRGSNILLTLHQIDRTLGEFNNASIRGHSLFWYLP